MRNILALLLLTLAVACQAQPSDIAPTSPQADMQSESATALAGGTWCEIGQPGMICLNVSPATSGGVIEYAITRDDCLEMGVISGSLMFLPYAASPSCIGGSAPAYSAVAVFVDSGLDLYIPETEATLELEQIN